MAISIREPDVIGNIPDVIEPDIHFDEPSAFSWPEIGVEETCHAMARMHSADGRKYSFEQVRYLLWRVLRMDEQEFRICRHKLNNPNADYGEIGNALAMTKQAVHKAVRKMRATDHPLSFLFGRGH